MKPTKGPWKVDGLDETDIFIEGPQHHQIASAHIDETNPKQAEANARLIAAAPSLYEVCLNLLEKSKALDKRERIMLRRVIDLVEVVK